MHIGVYAAETGVSRFGELSNQINYSKGEGLSLADLSSFDWLIAERSVEAKGLLREFEVVESVEVFDRLALRDLIRDPMGAWKRVGEVGLLGLLVHTRPRVDILRRVAR